MGARRVWGCSRLLVISQARLSKNLRPLYLSNTYYYISLILRACSSKTAFSGDEEDLTRHGRWWPASPYLRNVKACVLGKTKSQGNSVCDGACWTLLEVVRRRRHWPMVATTWACPARCSVPLPWDRLPSVSAPSVHVQGQPGGCEGFWRR